MVTMLAVISSILQAKGILSWWQHTFVPSVVCKGSIHTSFLPEE
jgi:hypothetical protein